MQTAANLKNSTISPLKALLLCAFVLISMIFFSGIALAILNPEALAESEVSIQPDHLGISIFVGLLVSYALLFMFTQEFAKHLATQILPNNRYWLAISVALGIILALLVIALQQTFPPPENFQTSVQSALSGGNISFVLIALSVVVIAPIGEEYLFRGILFDSFKRSYGFASALAFSTIIFTGFHLFDYYRYWVAWLAVLVLSIILGQIRDKSRSIGCTILVHFSYNATLMIITSL